MVIEILYHADIEEVKAAHPGEWIDLRVAENTFIPEGEYKLVSLGISVKLPDGYEAHVVPRSSTFKNFGIIQTNHMGVIDNSYSGPNDVWHFPAYCLNGKDNIDGRIGTLLAKNDRICQFRIVKCQDDCEIKKVEVLDGENRGGIGSTGVR